MEEPLMIEVQLGRIVIHEHGDSQYIFLVEKNGKRHFPIVIGKNEVHEIHRVISRDEPARPLTHQLAFTMLEKLGGTITRCEIVNLQRNTFFANLLVARGGEAAPLRIDARPSDAIALALRAKAPIFVADSVLEQVRTDNEGPDPLPPPETTKE